MPPLLAVAGAALPYIIGGATVYGASKMANKSAQQAADSVAGQNAANAQLHTMTPEEKANYFSQGVTKVNDATISSQGLLDRNLAGRGLGGNAVAAPNANLQRSRIKSISDIWNNLTNTAMNMRAGTPSVAAVPPVASTSQNFLSPFFNAGSSVTGSMLGSKLGTLFG